MPGILEIAGLLLIPAAITAAVAIFSRYFWPANPHFGLPIAAAVGFAVGCWSYGDRMPLGPERHWHWLPYLGLLAALLSNRASHSRWPVWVWPLSYAVIGVIAANELTPSYPDLKPARPVLAPLMAVYFALLMWLLSLLPARLLGTTFVMLLTLVAGGSALLVASAISLRLGTVALRVPAVLAVCACFAWYARKPANDEGDQSESDSDPALGLIPLYVVLTGGSAYAGATALPDRWLLLLAPAAPLALWLFAWGPLARFTGKIAIAVQCVTVLSIVLALLIWFNWPEPETAEWG